MRWFGRWLLLLLLAPGCGPARQPDYTDVVVLRGSPYQRGFQHGQLLESKIRSLYYKLLDTTLMPYLNREQDDVKSFLVEYQDPLYDDGQFSYQMMLQSGESLFRILQQEAPEYVEEMRGIADGSGMSFARILVLNTFVDTMLAFRSVTFFIRQLQSPRMLEMEFMGDFADGLDNNGDGRIDEPDDGFVKSRTQQGWSTDYTPRPHAAMVEVPTDASIRFVLWDPPGLGGFTGSPDEEPKEGDLQGMDPDSIRIQLDDVLYLATEDDCIQSSPWGEEGKGLEVIFTPPEGLPPGRVVTLYVQAHNISEIDNPPPVHPRVMRDERVVFTTRGAGFAPHEVDNAGVWDGRSMPPSIGFGVRGGATPDGRVRLAHHFALVDSDTTHKHTALFVHIPDEGRPHAVVGWAGVLWGFSGMNDAGLTYMVNPSDTLDNPLAGQVKQRAMYAKLLLTGIPVGIEGRRLLTRAETVDTARAMLEAEEHTFGWNLLLGDARGGLVAAELDANILGEDEGGCITFQPDPDDPGNLDEHGRLYGSVGGDDLRIGTHFQKNVPDIDTRILVFDVQPQFYWSSFYYRSLRAHAILGDQIARRYGSLDLEAMVDTLRTPGLVDTRDSMNAVVYEPETGVLHHAMGQVPATDGPFRAFDLASVAAEAAP